MSVNINPDTLVSKQSPKLELIKGTEFISGRVRATAETFQRLVDRAVKKALIKGGNRSIAEFLPTIAKKNGYMRRSVINKFNDALAKELVGRTNLIEIDIMDEIIIPATSRTFYTKYHTREHPAFNPAFAGGYKNPSTAGTMPMSIQRLAVNMSKNIRTAIKDELKAAGMDVS